MLRTCFRPWCQILQSQHRMAVRSMATVLKDFVSHYDTLEIYPECTKTEIREAWLKLSMKYHPDLNQGDDAAAKKFMDIKEAYKVLIDDEKRKKYNDKIGFYHHDPPPEYHREWTLQGEKDRSKAYGYQMMWSEEQIRGLMDSARLREVNWEKQTPAERYKILMEESKRVKNAKSELEALNTPTLREGMNRYMLMIVIVFFLNLLLQMARRNAIKDEYLACDLPRIYRDVETESGQFISAGAQIKYDRDKCLIEDPRKPMKYWIDPMWNVEKE